VIRLAMATDAPPLDPGRDEAYDWLVRELSKPEYEAAKPSLIDRIAQAIMDWFSSLMVPQPGQLSAWVPVIVVVLVIAGVITAIALWGVPRRRRAARDAGTLFGDDDTRTAAELRKHARDAAERGDWDSALLDGFRALARGLAERTVVSILPGTTASGVAESARSAFPSHAAALRRAASDFDSVRYLDEHAGREHYEAVASLDHELSRTEPRFAEPELVAP